MSRLLVELDGADRARAREVLDRCPTVELAPGAGTVLRDLPLATLLVVEEGVVRLADGHVGRGRRMVVAIAAPGEVVIGPRSGQELVALSRARLTALTVAAQRELLRVPAAAGALTAALMNAVCDREESLANCGRFPHVERVRGKLLQLASRVGRVRQGGVVIDAPLTHDLLAESVGATRETVTRALRELMRAGVVTRSGRRYRLNVSPHVVARASRHRP